jgi:hypothetical protein
VRNLGIGGKIVLSWLLKNWNVVLVELLRPGCTVRDFAFHKRLGIYRKNAHHIFKILLYNFVVIASSWLLK